MCSSRNILQCPKLVGEMPPGVGWLECQHKAKYEFLETTPEAVVLTIQPIAPLALALDPKLRLPECLRLTLLRRFNYKLLAVSAAAV
jgi:hypothetical protein